MRRPKTAPILGVLVLAFLLAHLSCGSTKPSRFYVLTPAAHPQERAARPGGLPDISVGIGPLKFPDHLLRPQIVVQTGANTLDYAEYDRWAEPLNDNFARVMAENLSKMIPSESIYIYPWKSTVKIRYQVNFEVMHFAQGPDGNVSLIVFWSLSNDATAEQLIRKKSTFARPGPGSLPTNYGSVVEVMSGLVEELSSEVVSEIMAISGR